MSSTSVEARPAATVMVLQDAGSGIEVLMVRRPSRGFFGGLTVFPGGGVDRDDDSELALAVAPGGQPDRVFRVAALRELAEETGLAVTGTGIVTAPEASGPDLFKSLLDMGITLDIGALTMVSRWVTPTYAPKRFDTHFFLLAAADVPEVRLASDELEDHFWMTPGAALDRQGSGELAMFLPTIAHLRWLDRIGSIEAAVAAAGNAGDRSLIQPQRMEDGSIVPVQLPPDP